MEIRKFKTDDVKEVHEIIRDNFIHINLGGHTKKGIDLQIENNSPTNLIEKSKYINYFVLSINEKIIGIGGYDNQKIHTLFIDLNYHKKGYGIKLLRRILSNAKNEGIKSIATLSTINAENFYKSFGFERIKEIIIPEGKRDIVLIEMRKNF